MKVTHLGYFTDMTAAEIEALTDAVDGNRYKASDTGDLYLGQSDGSITVEGIAQNQNGAETGLASFFTNVNSPTDIIHVRLPYNTTIDTRMYRVTAAGYCYAGSADGKVLDITWVGYCYATAAPKHRNFETLNKGSVNITSGQYVGSDNHIYLWFKPASIYFTNFNLKTMQVSNAPALLPSDIQIIVDPAITL